VPGAGFGNRLLVLGLTILAGLLLAPGRGVVAGCLLAAAATVALFRLARSRGGLNGDFLGAAVILGEIAACLGMFV
jgi:adenosylcobinamide-GDP ribazoletransferase